MITARQKPKRKYGEGSIYQRKDGRWVAKFKGEGMTKPRVVYAKSEPEAKRKLRELKKDAAKGIAECKKMLFCDYAERWLYTFKQHSGLYPEFCVNSALDVKRSKIFTRRHCNSRPPL